MDGIPIFKWNNLNVDSKLERVKISETTPHGRMGVKKRSRLDSQPLLSRKKSFNSTDSFSDKSNFGSSGPNSNTGIDNWILQLLNLENIPLSYLIHLSFSSKIQIQAQ